MPVVALNNWSVSLVPDKDGKLTDQCKVKITAWMADKDSGLIKSFLFKPKDGSATEPTESAGKGVQKQKAVYRRHEFVLAKDDIKPTEGTGGWSTSVSDGKMRITLTLGIHNRDQNPNYPIQTPEVINCIIGSAGADAGKKKKPKPAPKPDEVQANVESDEE